MKWAKKLYVTDGLKNQTSLLMTKIDAFEYPEVFVLTLPVNKNNLMEFFSIQNLKQDYYPDRELSILGLAENAEQAKILVNQIMGEIYKDGIDADPHAFLDSLFKN